MSSHKIIIAAFDFDGTITTKDTLFDFIRFYLGTGKLIKGIIVLAPTLLSYKLGFTKNDTAKQKLFSYFFKNKNIAEFNKICQKYAQQIDNITNATIIDKIKWHQDQNHTIVIVSASISNWIKPWASKIGVEAVLATEISIRNDIIIGSFSSPNCYGQEKVSRLLTVFPNRSEYTLYAYGDSSGDKELLALADYPTLLYK